ncbi:Hypp3336 [Branchiostoma lanceolatum]|uniref:Hypp3336 protein n=1 Tax=Branchiostoma lanceolatum TaxID=7740 RepID=A0A8K0EUA5_BRALA|nr:Hypp3336 [Branchiostoma lanceolatum]
MVLVIFVALLVAVTIPPSSGCDLPVGYERWNISRRVQAAELVVWGRVLAKHGPAATTSYTAEVQFVCQVKGDADALAMQGSFNVSNMGLVNPAHCVANNVDVDSHYFFFLTYSDEEVLLPQDINQQSAVIIDCEENRQAFARCCGFYPTFCRPPGGAERCAAPEQPNPDKPTQGGGDGTGIIPMTTTPYLSGAPVLGTPPILLCVVATFITGFIPF